MRKRNGITNGGGRSQMSRHVSQNADVSLVTGVQRKSGGRQSCDPASGPGGCHKPSSDHNSTRWGDEEEKRAER